MFSGSAEGMADEEIINQIAKDNLFQYPTEKSVRWMALACIRRLKLMEDETLVQAVASQPFQEEKQICLYAMMKQ